jgi:hypothetical protein
MNSIVLKSLLLFSFLFLPLFTQEALACSCRGLPTPYQTYKDAKAVFVGKVVAVKDASGKEIIENKLSDSIDERLGNETVRYYRFAVQESFKGVKANEFEVSSEINMCQSGFDVGSISLVYAYETKNGLTTSLFCSRTDSVETAQDDIYFLRGLLANKPEPRIYGSVQLNERVTATDSFRYIYLEGIKIVAESKNRRFEVVTDKNGLFSFYKIPNGKYKITPQLTNKYTPHWFNLHEVTLNNNEESFHLGYGEVEGRSGYADIQVKWNTKISGKISDADGKAVQNFAVKAANNNLSLNTEKRLQRFLENGDYSLSGFPPGSYILMVEVGSPFDTGYPTSQIFYPAARKLKAAEILKIDVNAEKKIDFKLPSEFILRKLFGELLWYDGTPVINGKISLHNSQDEKDKNDTKYAEVIVKDGRFKLQAFENAEYWIHAEVGTRERFFGESKVDLWEKGVKTLKAQPIKIKVGKTDSPIKIIIPLPDGL